MAPWFDYEIAVGHDNYTTANFEAYFDVPLRGRRVPLGSVTEKSLSGKERTDGEQLVELTQDACIFDELEAYVETVFTNWDTQNANVTLRHRKRDNTFAYHNAIAHLPIEGEDYEHLTVGIVTDVRLRFTLLEEIADPE